MPALPGKSSRRKNTTPRAKQDKEDVWERTFDIMGLEPLSSNKDNTSTMATASDISSPSPAEPSPAQGSEKKKITIFDLPSETQKDIFKYVSTLFALASLTATEVQGLTILLAVQHHRSHCPLSRVETFQRNRRGTIIPKLPYCLPR